MKENEKIRKAARVADVQLYKVAMRLGVSEVTLSRWLRFSLPFEKEQAILKAIEELEKEAD